MEEDVDEEHRSKVKFLTVPLLALHRFANDKPGVTLTFILAIIFGVLSILGNYSLLPCQTAALSGKSCFEKSSGAPSPSPPQPLPQPQPQPPRPSPQPEPSPPEPLPQQQIPPLPTPAPFSVDDARAEALAELRQKASMWLNRKGIQYDDFGSTMDKFRDDASLKGDDKNARDILLKAENVLEWRRRGWNPGNRRRVPVYVQTEYSNKVAEELGKNIKERLQIDGDGITDRFPDAAMILTLQKTGLREEAMDEYARRAVTLSANLVATWVGGAICAIIPLSESGSGSPTPYDLESAGNGAARQQAVTKVEEEANSAIAEINCRDVH